MLNPEQFRNEIIRPVLTMLDGRDGKSWTGAAAEELLLGTALVESNLTWLVQHGGGPAISVFQMEPATINDIQENFIRHRPMLREAVELTAGVWPIMPEALKGNLYLAAMMCRIHYRRVPAPLPEAGDVGGMAKYWKKFYNTAKGKGTVGKYREAWQRSGLAN